MPLTPGARLGPYEMVARIGAGDGQIMAAGVKAAPSGFTVGAPVPLFDSRLVIPAFVARVCYDVTRDGRQFYLVARDETVKSDPVTVLVDRQAGLPK